MTLRDAQPADADAVLVLNEASVAVLSPLTRPRLDALRREAVYFRVAEVGPGTSEGEVAAFLLAFAGGAAYDSLNYQWFDARYRRFVYVDRVVVGRSFRGQGIGSRLYRDLIACAREYGAEAVTCEYDVDPPNHASRRFHEKLGFAEVGTRQVCTNGGKEKQVSLQALRL